MYTSYYYTQSIIHKANTVHFCLRVFRKMQDFIPRASYLS